MNIPEMRSLAIPALAGLAAGLSIALAWQRLTTAAPPLRSVSETTMCKTLPGDSQPLCTTIKTVTTTSTSR